MKDVVTTPEDITIPRQYRYGRIEFIRRIYRDQLSIWVPELFDRNIFYTKFLFRDFFFLNKPEYIEHVLLEHQQNYEKGPISRRILQPTFGNGLFTSEGEFWRRQRRIAAPAFHHRRIQEFATVMAQSTADMLGRWSPNETSFNVCAEMMALTLDIIVKTMFSSEIGSAVTRVRDLMNVVIEQSVPNLLDLFGVPDWVPRRRNRRLAAALRELDALVAGFLAERRRNPHDRGDLLSMLLAARDPESGEGMTDRQLRDEIMTIFLAGHETTANALGWVWYLLALHPEIETKLHDEVDHVLGGHAPTFADLPSLSLTRRVFDEALRLYPPAHMIGRFAIKDDVIGGVTIPAGAAVTVSPYVTHRNPTLWPDPERFDPDRFLPENCLKRHRFAYFPFGGGPRICIGMGFAISEAQIIMASVVQKFRLQLDPTHPVAPVGRMTLRAQGGIWMSLERRVPAGGDK